MKIYVADHVHLVHRRDQHQRCAVAHVVAIGPGGTDASLTVQELGASERATAYHDPDGTLAHSSGYVGGGGTKSERRLSWHRLDECPGK